MRHLLLCLLCLLARRVAQAKYRSPSDNHHKRERKAAKGKRAGKEDIFTEHNLGTPFNTVTDGTDTGMVGPFPTDRDNKDLLDTGDFQVSG